MIGNGRYGRFTGRYAGFGGLDGYLRCSYVELVEALGWPNVGLSNDRKTAFGWRIVDRRSGKPIMVYAWKATRDYDKTLPTRAALRRAPEHRWHVTSAGADLTSFSTALSESAGRTIAVDRE